jgi:hypothetical protein
MTASKPQPRSPATFSQRGQRRSFAGCVKAEAFAIA